MNAERNSRPLIAAGTCLGIGMGGFVDGIVFHQILQLHSMLSNWVVRDSVVNLQVNMFWDGLFHAFTWFMTALGIFLLWRAILREDVPRSGRILLGSMLLGWGLFNLIEGIIDHQILQVHHVIQDGSHILGDFLFLMSGFFLLLVGGSLIRAGHRDATESDHV